MHQFRTDHQPLQRKYTAAWEGLAANVQRPFQPGDQAGFDLPILIEGCGYDGVWLECGPLEGLVYGLLGNVAVAKANHEIFFATQREDGYIHFTFNRSFPQGGTGAIQMVVPIAKTAFELYAFTQDRAFLEQAYEACARWDHWLAKHRDSRGLGLCELFCMWDTGHDHSTRFKFIKEFPHHCPDHDASRCPAQGSLPWLAPDLSATLYGGRVALSRMALELGREQEATQWVSKAEQTRRAILAYLFDPETLCFYDLDCTGRFNRIVNDALTRVLCELVVDSSLFEAIFSRHIVNPHGFWTPFPMPSVAVSDPAFDHQMPPNCWGGPTQALTALRAPRWFEPYGKAQELTHMMQRWVEALVVAPDFSQQMNPWSGEFSRGAGYSPAMCVLLDFVARLYGVRWEANLWAGPDSTPSLEWNVRIPPEATETVYQVSTPGGLAKLHNVQGQAQLSIDGQECLLVTGTCRVVTDLAGSLQAVVGTEAETVHVNLTRSRGGCVSLELRPNEVYRGPFF